ncbi:hypothetical protein HY484_00915 [Candidatus Woesearchaeota archaeon]|nr:hypothetical protein [Candidatus Woesearchaeota archaeon]
MKKVEVNFKRLEIVRAFPRDNSVEVCLMLNDGKDKIMSRSVKLDNTVLVADELIREVRNKMQLLHKSESFDDDVLSGITVIKFLQDEDLLLEKISKFLSSAREKIKVASTGRLSYYDMEFQLKKTVLEFNRDF